VTNSGWNTFEITANKESLAVVISGKKVVDTKNGKNRVGYVEFVSENRAKLELRSVRLKPLNLDAIYNGTNLDGWKSVNAPPPEKSSKLKLPGLSHKPKPLKNATWSGAAGVIHGESGIGQLESANAYDDFVVQFLGRADIAHEQERSSAQMFFRGDAGRFETGYGVNLVNRKGNATRTNIGSGGLIDLQSSRLPAVLDATNFAATVIAREHRLSVWINGLLVTDYYDSRPEGVYHSAAGTLGFRLENETAKLDIREVRVAVLPKGPHAPAPPEPAVASALASGPGGAAAVPPFPGQSPADKAKQEQLRQLTAQALEAKDPAEVVRINKQILLLDPADLPAQQRLDKAREKLDRANAEQAKAEQQQHEAESTTEANKRRREGLMQQSQEKLIHEDLDGSRKDLNDAERLGATGPQTERLKSIIVQRMRSRLLMRLGIGATGLIGLSALIMLLWRSRNRTLTPYLLTVDGVEKGKRHLLNQDVTHLGAVDTDSGKKNEILVRDPDRMVSRFHCEVHRRGNTFYAIDLNSSNGTFLGSKRLQPGVAVRLRDGRRIALAKAATFELQLERSRH
jgi:hypothetical protein